MTRDRQAGNVAAMRIIQRPAGIVALLVVCAIASSAAAGNEVVKVDFYVTVPADTDPNATIYLAGNLPQLGGWRADGVRLAKVNGDPVYHAQLPLPRGAKLEYKITRGSWETVEKGPSGEELHNRTLTLDKDTTEQIKVANWRNDAAAATMPAAQRESTVTGDLRTHEIDSKIMRNHRKLLVWLPPDYEKDPQKRYPVLYMQDGQNLFDDATSFAGEWHADEIADRLIRGGKISPIIIVGIENTWQRALEYTPGSATAPGRGAQYAKFVVEEVKPLIDQTYRTKPEPADTGIAGSSLGGLVSLYLLQKYPQVISRCGAVSPSLWWDDEQFLAELIRDTSWSRNARVWIDMGTAESDDPQRLQQNIDNCTALADALQKSGRRPNKDFVWQAYEAAEHNEQAWADRFDEILIFLFGNQ